MRDRGGRVEAEDGDVMVEVMVIWNLRQLW